MPVAQHPEPRATEVRARQVQTEELTFQKASARRVAPCSTDFRTPLACRERGTQ